MPIDAVLLKLSVGCTASIAVIAALSWACPERALADDLAADAV